MAGRLNKLLEFIGLVDDEPEEEFDGPRNRPQGGQTYGGGQSGRRAPQPPPSARSSSRSGYYDAGRSDRYSTTSSRPDYEARQRPSGYGGSASPSRYGSDYGSPAPYGGYQSTSRGDYQSGARDYSQPSRASDYRSSRRESLDDEFERDADRRAARQRSAPKQSNVVPINQVPSGHQTVIYYLRSLEECRDVINDLLDTKSVLLNLEEMDERSMQRSVDTLCGAAFALGATLRKASDKTYLIAPNNVMVASTNGDADRYT